jgi:MFS family permease
MLTDTPQRWWLGVAEAGLFPGINYYLSCYYKRSEFGIRAAIFFSAAALAGSFGGLLAAGIAQMGGVGGKPGWAWIFVCPLSVSKAANESNIRDRFSKV